LKVNDVLSYLDCVASFNTCEEWDNCGLLVGDKNGEVGTVLVSLDVTDEVLKEAEKVKAELIVAHHPIIFGGQSCVLSDSLVYKAIKSGIAVIGYHTCFDNYKQGVSYTLAKTLGLFNASPNEQCPCLFTGTQKFDGTRELVAHVNKTLNTNAVFVDSGKPVNKIAVCGGSGGDFLTLAFETGADAFITGECKYHHFLKAREIGISLIAAGHYETEVPCIPVLAERLKARFPSVDVIPWTKKPPVLTLE
jgi:dinuclear metal center YbgI/SA1388 family protein